MASQVVAGRFELGASIGRGGMGTVFEARDLDRGGNRVAVKLLHDATDPDRFVREARVLAAIDHPAVVRYVAHGRDGDAPYLVMEWLDGEDLATRISRGPLTVVRAVALARRIAEGLGAAHRAGVVHRDVKPSNVFLPRGDLDSAKVLDFGVARWTSGASLRTSTGVVLGTPQYLAPEQARGEADVDARADVFALGCVLFECIVGRPAFAADHLVAVLAKVLFEDVPRLSALNGDASDALDALAARMTAKDRSARPPDGAAVAALLASLAEPTARGDGRSSSPVVAHATHASSTPMREEQRLVAVVLARQRGIDLEGAATVDLAILTERFTDVRALVEQLGGAAEVLADGSICALFSEAVTAKDLAAQGARCALSVRALLGGFVVALVMARAPLGARRSGAEAFDRAASLLRLLEEEARPADVVWLDDLAARLVDDRFDVDGHHLLGARLDAAVAGGSRNLLARAVPCVGRDRELASLRATYEECIEEPRSRAVIVTAISGTGKSRLAAELAASLRDHPTPPAIHAVSGEPLRAATAFGMLAPLIERVAGIRPGGSRETVQSALRARVARGVAAEHVDRIAVYLAEIAGAPFSADALPGLDAARRDALILFERTRSAFCQWLASETAFAPLVLVLDDLHWGDAPTVRFLDAALRELADRPLFVLALARPEIEEGFPNLWAGPGAQQMRLPPLGKKVSAAFVRGVLGEQAGPSTVERIVGLAQGNPFFLEELIRATADPALREALPESVLAMAAARVHRLPDGPRRVLRAACVFGQTFWVEGVMSVLGETARPVAEIAELVAAELIALRPESRFAKTTELSFRHALIQEAVYATVLAGDRAAGHRAAAAWLEAAGETSCAVIGEHYDRGADRDRAAEWLVGASEQASDFAVALDFTKRAEVLGVPGGARTCRLLLARGRALYGLERWPEAQETLTAALDHADSEARQSEILVAITGRTDGLDLGATTRRAADAAALAARSERPELEAMGLGHLAVYYSTRGDLERADGYAKEARRLVRAGGPDSPILFMLSSVLSYWRGNLDAAIATVGEDVATAREAGNALRLVFVLPALGMALASRGRYHEALAAFDEARALADATGASAMKAWPRGFAVGLHLDVQDWVAVARLAEEALELSREAGFKQGIVSSGIDRVLAATARGELERAESVVAKIAPLAEQARDWHGWLWELRLAYARGELAYARGELEEAIAWADRSLAANAGNRRPKYVARALALRARARAKLGQTDAAKEDLMVALRVVRPTGDLPTLVTVGGEVLALEEDPALAHELGAIVERLASGLPDAARAAFLRAPGIMRISGS